MTVPGPSTASISVQGGGTKGWGRPAASSSSEAAEGEFGRQLAGIAAKGDRSDQPAASVEENPGTAWSRPVEADWTSAGGPDRNDDGSGDAMGDVAPAGTAQVDGSMPAALAVLSAARQQGPEQAAPPAPPTPGPADAQLELALMRARAAALTGATAPAARVPAALAVPKISVVSREVHLPPTAFQHTDTPPVGDVSHEALDLLDGQAHPSPTSAQASRGRDAGHWSAQGSQPGLASAAQTSVLESAADDIQLDVDAAATGAIARDAQDMAQSPSSPLRQVADRIVSELQSAGEASRANRTPAGPAQTTALKVVTIQLHPAELGAVTVRIALRDDALELQIEAGRHDTARLVEADRDGLSTLLRAAGYSVETLIVRAVEMPSAAAQAGSSPLSGDGGAAQAQSGGAQANAGASDERSHSEQNGNHHPISRGGHDEPDSARRRPGDGVYL